MRVMWINNLIPFSLDCLPATSFLSSLLLSSLASYLQFFAKTSVTKCYFVKVIINSIDDTLLQETIRKRYYSHIRRSI